LKLSSFTDAYIFLPFRFIYRHYSKTIIWFVKNTSYGVQTMNSHKARFRTHSKKSNIVRRKIIVILLGTVCIPFVKTTRKFRGVWRLYDSGSGAEVGFFTHYIIVQNLKKTTPPIFLKISYYTASTAIFLLLSPPPA